MGGDTITAIDLTSLDSWRVTESLEKGEDGAGACQHFLF